MHLKVIKRSVWENLKNHLIFDSMNCHCAFAIRAICISWETRICHLAETTSERLCRPNAEEINVLIKILRIFSLVIEIRKSTEQTIEIYLEHSKNKSEDEDRAHVSAKDDSEQILSNKYLKIVRYSGFERIDWLSI